MGFLFASGILFLIGLAAGFEGSSRRALGPALTITLGCSMISAGVLGRWVLAIDPGRGTGTVPLPSPWSSVLPALAVGLLIALPTSLGGFIGLSVGDFMTRRTSRWIRLVGYAIVFGALVATAPWIFGVTFD
jgi:hypothetical protein